MDKKADMAKMTSEQVMARVEEITDKIDALMKERNDLENVLDLKGANTKLDRIVGKWVRINGWNDYEEDVKTSHYRICHIDAPETWYFGGDSFKLRVSYIAYLSKSPKSAALDIGFGAMKPDVIIVNDVTKVKVLTAERAKDELKALGNTVIKRIEKILNQIK